MSKKWFVISKDEDKGEKFIQKNDADSVIRFLSEVAVGDIPIEVLRIFSVDTSANVDFYTLSFKNFKFSLILEDSQ